MKFIHKDITFLILFLLSSIVRTNARRLRSMKNQRDMQVITKKPADEPLYCPTDRYNTWTTIPIFYRTRVISMKLGYTAATWNFEPYELYWNPLENHAWNSTQVEPFYDDLANLGYDEDRWDCCINHYEEFELDEFLYWNYTEQIEAHYALGWTDETFRSDNASLWPATEFLPWNNLTEYQRYMAASKLCHTEETWDEKLALYNWPVGFAYPDAW